MTSTEWGIVLTLFGVGVVFVLIGLAIIRFNPSFERKPKDPTPLKDTQSNRVDPTKDPHKFVLDEEEGKRFTALHRPSNFNMWGPTPGWTDPESWHL